MLQIGASDAFDNKNRELSLHNVQFNCLNPLLSSEHVSESSAAVHRESHRSESQEVTTQGDNSAMAYLLRYRHEALDGETRMRKFSTGMVYR